VVLCLAFLAAPAAATVNLGLPNNTEVNFDGNGVFDQTIPGSFDLLGPMPAAIGTKLFGVGTISDIAFTNDLGSMIWKPGDVGPNFEMTFTFWDAAVTSSSRIWLGTPGASTAFLTASYADGARLMLVSDTTKDFNSTGGPGLFDTQDGEYPTVYTLEDAGYNSDSLPDAGSSFIYADDAGEEVFLDLALSGNSSVIMWNPAVGFMGGSFSSQAIEILGGTGASQFSDFFGPDGQADAFILSFQPTGGWAYGGDIDIQLTSIPEPSTLIFFGTGLASLIGYSFRRRMA
jgi:hypothetical protein